MQAAIQATQSQYSTPISPSGEIGGRILFAGTPEALTATDTHTGRRLRDERRGFVWERFSDGSACSKRPGSRSSFSRCLPYLKGRPSA